MQTRLWACAEGQLVSGRPACNDASSQRTNEETCPMPPAWYPDPAVPGLLRLGRAWLHHPDRESVVPVSGRARSPSARRPRAQHGQAVVGAVPGNGPSGHTRADRGILFHHGGGAVGSSVRHDGGGCGVGREKNDHRGWARARSAIDALIATPERVGRNGDLVGY
jgi:hypothetical protein